jgi:hypothetical protein
VKGEIRELGKWKESRRNDSCINMSLKSLLQHIEMSLNSNYNILKCDRNLYYNI